MKTGVLTLMLVILACSGATSRAAYLPRVVIGAPATSNGFTLTMGVIGPSARVTITVPAGIGTPHLLPGDAAGHSFIADAGGAGERQTVLAQDPAVAVVCAPGSHEQVWSVDFAAGRVFVTIDSQRVTICPIPATTATLFITTKPWTLPRGAGDYIWHGSFDSGPEVDAVVRLPVVLTLARVGVTARGVATVRGRLTGNGSPIAARNVQLFGTGGQSVSTRTSANGAFTAKLKLTKRSVVKAVAVIEPDVPEPFLVQSRNVTLVPPKTRHP
jgi:hypothetical protein